MDVQFRTLRSRGLISARSVSELYQFGPEDVADIHYYQLGTFWRGLL